jgi:acyl dehydratase
MPINHDAVGATSEPVEASWDSAASLLYSLGVGAGATDATGFELEFTTENSADVKQKALPTMPVVITPDDPGAAGMGVFAALGEIDGTMAVHGEQSVTLHRPLPVEGKVKLQTTIAGIYDKGKGALVVIENDAVDVTDGMPLYTASLGMYIRGEGGWGGDRGPSGPRNVAPERAPDEIVRYPTRPDQALLYRLNGDRNPLHSDPTFAKLAGFDKPILHGLCTFGFTGRALLHAICDSEPARFKHMEGRFSAPVMPGDTLEVRMWVDGSEAIYQTYVDDKVVLDAGKLTFT